MRFGRIVFGIAAAYGAIELRAVFPARRRSRHPHTHQQGSKPDARSIHGARELDTRILAAVRCADRRVDGDSHADSSAAIESAEFKLFFIFFLPGVIKIGVLPSKRVSGT